jgi:predicted dehydrogenase
MLDLSDRRVSVGIIGAGYMAEEHIKAFQALDNVEISGIYSRTYLKAEILANKYGIKFCCKSVDDLYMQSKPDVIVIAITETAVEDLVDEIAHYPWVVLFEKPVGLDYEQSKRISDKIDLFGMQAIVALNRRFYSSTRQLVHDLANTQGTRLIQVNDYESLSIAKSFNYAEIIINNWMYANSVHLIDYFCFLGRGKIEKVNVIQSWNQKSLMPVIAHITYESGDQGIYHGIWHGPGPWSVSIVTESDYFEMRPLEQLAKRSSQEKTLHLYPQSSHDLNFKPGLYEQALNTVAFVLQLPSLSVTLNEYMHTVKLVRDIYINT